MSALGPLPASALPLRVVVDPGGGAAYDRGPAPRRGAGGRGHRDPHASPTAASRARRSRWPRTSRRARGRRARRAAPTSASRRTWTATASRSWTRAGRAIGEELTLVLAAEQVLTTDAGPGGHQPRRRATPIDAMATRHGCPVFRTKVGEANVAEGMRLHGAVIGGEGNGGVIWPSVNFARDSLVGMGLVLHRLAAAGRPVSALAAEYDRFQTREAAAPLPGRAGPRDPEARARGVGRPARRHDRRREGAPRRTAGSSCAGRTPSRSCA